MADARICANRVKNHIDVSLRELVGNHSKLVREADLHRDVAVYGNLCELRADDRHPGDPAFVTNVFSIKLFQCRTAFRIAFADQDKVRFEQSVNYIAERNEFRVITDMKP